MGRVAIVGAGVQGLMAALFLRERGWEVSILEQSDATWGCSYVNTGMIVPSHVVPLASPGTIGLGLRLALNPRGPFAIFPRPTVTWRRWLSQFRRHSTSRHVRLAAPALAALHLASREIYLHDLVDRLHLEISTAGVAMLYRTASGERSELDAADIAARTGVEPKLLSPDDLGTLDPDVRFTVSGAVYYASDCNQDPVALMTALKAHLRRVGVEILTGARVSRIVVESGTVRGLQAEMIGDRETESRSAGRRNLRSKSIEADEFLVAAGAFSGRVLATAGVTLPMLAGKGYSTDIPNPGLRTAYILSEARVAVSPMGSRVRFGGTMEVREPVSGGSSDPGRGRSGAVGISRARIAGIADAVPHYLPEVHLPRASAAFRYGLRPLSADGLPYIGRVQAAQNLSVVAGHGMMGVSLAAASGHAIAAVIAGVEPDIDISAFSPGRFSG